jgi:hypothetical protein
MGALLHIYGPNLYILDMNGHQCLRKCVVGVITSSDEVVFGTCV